MERWQNRVAVVTGASCGIGAACCKYLVARGMIVVGLARRLERMENELKAGLPKDQQSRFYAVRCDVTKEENIIKAFDWVDEHLGGVDVLVNNAGIIRPNIQIVSENNTDDLRDIIDTNVMGVALCTRQAFRSMKKRNFDGHIVNINSVVGHMVPFYEGFNLSMYPSSKYAVTAMTEVLRQEFMRNDTKIKITSISPGGVKTEIVDLNKVLEGLPVQEKEIPLLRPEDVADAVVYCIQTPPNVQIHEMIIKPLGEKS